MKMKRTGILVLLLALTLSLFGGTALADFPTPPGTPSISVEAKTPVGQPVPGMSFSLYKVATVDDAGRVTPTAKAAALGVSVPATTLPGTISDSEAWKTALTTLGGYVDRLDKVGSDMTTAADGSLVFGFGNSYEPGIYLIVGKDLVDGTSTYKAQTAWTQIPLPRSNGGWDFNPVVQPKISISATPAPAKTVQVVKVWDDAYRPDERPLTVTVELLKDGTVDRTQTLSAPSWTHTWTGLDGNSTWTVREQTVPRYYSMTSTSTVDPQNPNNTIFTITNTRCFGVGDPPIQKLVQGDPGAPAATSTFTFRMEAISNTVGLPVAEMPMPAGSSGGVKIGSITGPGSYEFGDFRFYLPGTYIYKLSEVDVGEAGYRYDQNFYYKVFEVREGSSGFIVSEQLLDNRQQALQDIDPTFVNTWKPDPTDSVSVTLSAIKRLSGVTPPTTADFVFNLIGTNGAPMPTGSSNSRKSITVHGAGSGSFGAITFTAPGTYVYKVSEQNGRVDGYTYDSSVYTVTVVVSRNAQNKLTAAVTAVKNSSQTAQWDNLVFTNSYKEPSPHTGILWWPVPVLLASGLLLTFAGLVRRRHES